MTPFGSEARRAASVHTCLRNDVKHLAGGTKAEHRSAAEKQQADADLKKKVEGEKHLPAPLNGTNQTGMEKWTGCWWGQFMAKVNR